MGPFKGRCHPAGITFLALFFLGLSGCFKSEAEKILLSANVKPESNCNVDKRCGDLVGINCKAEVDGPYYYIHEKEKRLVQCCGGCCMRPSSERKGTQCGECPPKQWNCSR